MNLLFECLQAPVVSLTELSADTIKPLSQINDLTKAHWTYAVTFEVGSDQLFKGRKGIFETLLFINCYSRAGVNPDMAVMSLTRKVVSALDETTPSNSKVKIHNIKYYPCHPQPAKNSLLDAWQSVAGFQVRWEEVESVP